MGQLVEALAEVGSNGGPQQHGVGDASQRITDSAALNGEELLRTGFTVAQVVHGYGDVCQVVTELASETGAEIASEDFTYSIDVSMTPLREQ